MNQVLFGHIGFILVNFAYAENHVNGDVRQGGVINPYDRQQESAPSW